MTTNNIFYEMVLLDFVFTREPDKMKKVVQWYADKGVSKETLLEWYEKMRKDLPDEEERILMVMDMITGWAGNPDYHIQFSPERQARVAKGLPGEVAELA